MSGLTQATIRFFTPLNPNIIKNEKKAFQHLLFECFF